MCVCLGGVIKGVEEDIIFPYQHPTSKMTSIIEEGTPSRHRREGCESSVAHSKSGELSVSLVCHSQSAFVRTPSAPSRVPLRKDYVVKNTTSENTTNNTTSCGVFTRKLWCFLWCFLLGSCGVFQ